MNIKPILLKNGVERISVDELITRNIKWLMYKSTLSKSSEHLTHLLNEIEQGLLEKQEYERLVLYLSIIPATCDYSVIQPYLTHLAQIDNSKWKSHCLFVKKEYAYYQNKESNTPYHVIVSEVWRQFLMRCVSELRILKLETTE